MSVRSEDALIATRDERREHFALADGPRRGSAHHLLRELGEPLAKEVLPFVENDFTKAVSQAKKSGKPIFVDTWAPW